MVAAGILTAIVLPLAWIAGGSTEPTEATIATTVLVTTTTLDTGLSSSANADSAANLEGPTALVQTGTGQIAYPAQTPINSLRGRATFKRFPDSAITGCATSAVPLGTEVTVLNLNNGRKVKCININIGYIPSGADIVVHTGLFENLANLIDAPLPVELRW